MTLSMTSVHTQAQIAFLQKQNSWKNVESFLAPGNLSNSFTLGKGVFH